MIGRASAMGFIVAVLSAPIAADEYVQMSNGMNCWRNDTGHLHGCTGGVDTGDRGFNDVRTGTRYNYINPHQAIDSRSGLPVDIYEHRNEFSPGEYR